MLHIATPLLESRAISQLTGKRVYLKMEALQPAGSFKIRGIGYACEQYLSRGAVRFVAASGGNAGLAVAYAARKLQVPATIVVPHTTKLSAVRAIELEGAEVVVQGENWQAAHEFACALVGPRDAYIHPFDDLLIWNGHAGMIDEIAATGLIPDEVVVAVGGGGLFAGVAIGLERNGWSQTAIVAAETQGADKLAQSLRAGRSIHLEKITSIASSLGASYVCNYAYDYAQRAAVRSVVVSDEEAQQAARYFLRDHRVAVEPACGAALAIAYGAHMNDPAVTTTVIIVCGGVGIDFKDLLPS